MIACQCEADLPEALRFGRVEVSCEGWDGPGDPYVLKGEGSLLPTFCRHPANDFVLSLGSCGLSYRLVEVPNALRGGTESHSLPSRLFRWFGSEFTTMVVLRLAPLTRNPCSPGYIIDYLHDGLDRTRGLHLVCFPEVVF